MKASALISTGILSLFITITSCGGESTEKQESKNTEAEMEYDTNDVGTISTAVDPKLSIVKWKGEMLGIYTHEGTLKFKEGYISEYKGKLTGGGFVIDMSTLEATDDNFKPEEGRTKEKLKEHLLSPEFFNVESYPYAFFDIHEVMGDSLKGQLAINGKQKIETIGNFSITPKGNVKILKGTLTFNRKDYGVSYDSPAKDMVISDDITLDVKIVTGDFSNL